MELKKRSKTPKPRLLNNPPQIQIIPSPQESSCRCLDSFNATKEEIQEISPGLKANKRFNDPKIILHSIRDDNLYIITLQPTFFKINNIPSFRINGL